MPPLETVERIQQRFNEILSKAQNFGYIDPSDVDFLTQVIEEGTQPYASLSDQRAARLAAGVIARLTGYVPERAREAFHPEGWGGIPTFGSLTERAESGLRWSGLTGTFEPRAVSSLLERVERGGPWLTHQARMGAMGTLANIAQQVPGFGRVALENLEKLAPSAPPDAIPTLATSAGFAPFAAGVQASLMGEVSPEYVRQMGELLSRAPSGLPTVALMDLQRGIRDLLTETFGISPEQIMQIWG